jgi:hypothetical protein
MTKNNFDADSAVEHRLQFTIGSLLWVTFLASCILAAYRSLGPHYGGHSIIPLTVVAILALATRGWTIPACSLGFVILWLTIELAVRFNSNDAHQVKAMLVLGFFGAAAGGSIHAIILRRRSLGIVLLAVSMLAGLYTLRWV